MYFNRIKTVLLLAGMSALLLLLGNIFGGTAGMHFAFILALIMNGIAYFFSDKIVLAMYKAQPLDAQEFSWIYEIIEELRLKMNIPMPKLWLIQTPMANAFATGRSPNHASVAVTTGILSILDRDELRGVLAHELSHVKNRDILVSTIAATFATAIGYLASMMQHLAFWDSVHDRKRSGNNPIVMLLISIIMPIAAMLLQLAISRSREYLADETGAQCCHDPLALASALQKLHSHIGQAHLDEQDSKKASTSALFIVHPFCSDSISSLFSTHPPMRKRIERLHKLHEKMF